MYITNVTDDYKDTLSINNICTNNYNNIETVIPLITIIPCGLSLICLISLIVYSIYFSQTFIRQKIIFVEYKWRNFYTQIIQLGVL